MEALRPGVPRRIGGYRLVGRLGAGGMGEVFLGRSPGGLLVAIKVVHPHLAEDPDFRGRFRREVGAARSVSGAFTAPVIDADTEAPSPWLATAYLPGMSLQDAVAGHGPLPVAAVFALGAGLAEALVSIHRAGVVHRDLKPSNVMLGTDGPRVIDFGIAHAADSGVITAAGSAVGSPGFIAPEQARGETTGPASDVFSLAAVLVYAATGAGPFGEGPPHVLIYRVVHEPPRLDAVPDPALRDLIGTCLDPDPRRRPPSAFLLDRLASLAPPASDPHGTDWLPASVAALIANASGEVTPPRTPPRGTSRRRVLLGAGVGAVAVAGGAGLVAALLDDGSPPAARPSPSPTAAAPSPRPVRDAKVLWKRNTGATYLISSPAVAGGTVFVGCEKGILLAYDAKTGKPRWRHPTGARITSQPSVVNGVVYVANVDGAVHAVDARTGRSRWQRTVSDTLTDTIVSGGTVYAGGDPLYALSASSGAVKWHAPGGDNYSAFHAAGGALVYVSRDQSLDALDVRTGRRRWTYRMTKGCGAPLVSGGVVYCGNFQGDEVHALDAETGRNRWTYRLTSPITARPAISGGQVFVGDWDQNLYAIDAATGSMRWQLQTGGQIHGNPVAAGGMLYVPSGVYSEGNLYAVEAATGRADWRFFRGDGFDSSPAVADGVVYASCKDGYLYALDVRGGTGTPPA